MRRLIPLILSIVLCSLIVFSCSEYREEGFTGSLTLTNFTYTGTDTVFFTLFPNEWNNWLDFNNLGSGLVPFGAQSDESGTYDIQIADINLEKTNFSSEDGLTVWLVIASDNNITGQLDTGDDIMPVYSLTIANGEDVIIDGLEFDAASTLTAAPYQRYIRFRLESTLPAEVSVDNPVILRVDNLANFDFKNNSPNFRKILIPDIRLVNDLVLYSVPDIDDNYYILFGHDSNGSGSLDINDYASESDRTIISKNFSIFAGNYEENEVSLSINGITRITN